MTANLHDGAPSLYANRLIYVKKKKRLECLSSIYSYNARGIYAEPAQSRQFNTWSYNTKFRFMAEAPSGLSLITN
jgi:hypothetical protein